EFTFTNPKIDKTVTVYIDEQRMEQVFSNLLWNAVDHTAPTSGKIDVYVEVNQVTQEVVFRFVDNGRGIEDNLIPFIFDRYYKVKKLPEEYHGTGVGLAIVKEIIQAHGGRVWAESKKNVGSTFYIALPLKTK